MAGGGGGGGDGDYGLQIAPMLDVMFVLMLFFMVMAGTQIKEAELGIDLPSIAGPSRNKEKPPVPIQIKIDARNQVFYNDFPVDTPRNDSLPELQKRLEKALKNYGLKNPVVILPAETVAHRRVVDVMNACSAANVLNLSFGES